MDSFLIVTIIITLFGQVQESQQKDVPLPDLKDIVVAGPYCGIYSLVACFNAFDKKVSLEDLLKPDYVGSYRGSSNKELVAAAEKYGLYGKSYGNITWQVLKEIKEPAILHFRGGLDSEFNHWVAFLGCEGSHVRIVDYPHELTTLTMAELLAHWDGTAILFSEKPITNDLVWKSRLDFLITALILFGAAFLYKIYFYNKNNEPEFAPTRKEFFRRAFVQTATLLTATFVADRNCFAVVRRNAVSAHRCADCLLLPFFRQAGLIADCHPPNPFPPKNLPAARANTPCSF